MPAEPLRPVRPAAAVAGGRDLMLPGDGIRLAATRWNGVGAPVLLLHGLASTRRFWNLVVPHLAGLPVVALDLRGHGESEQPDDGYDTPTIVRDVTTALDSLGISRVVAVGHSWGAAVALSLAAMHPERTLAVVAIDGGVGSPSRRFATRDEARVALAPPRLAVPPEQLPELLRSHSALRDRWRPELEDAVLPIFGVGADGLARARLHFDNHLRVVDALFDYDARDVLPKVAAPAWLLIATPLQDDDPEAGWAREKLAALDEARELLRRPRAITLGGAVHDVPLQWPAVVAGVVRSAVDDASTRGPVEDG